MRSASWEGKRSPPGGEAPGVSHKPRACWPKREDTEIIPLGPPPRLWDPGWASSPGSGTRGRGTITDVIGAGGNMVVR